MTQASPLEKDLRSITSALPPWARWMYRLFLLWFLPILHRAEINLARREMNSAIKKIGDTGQRETRRRIAERAVEIERKRNPNAKIKILPMPSHGTDAIYIEHPPSPDDHAQQALGFGSIEIKAPFASLQ